MRVPKTWIPPMSKRISDTLVGDGLIETPANAAGLLAEIEALITEELSAEDRLNDEVREMLKKFGPEIEKGRLDYRKLFDLTKQKLVKERNIVL